MCLNKVDDTKGLFALSLDINENCSLNYCLNKKFGRNTTNEKCKICN